MGWIFLHYKSNQGPPSGRNGMLGRESVRIADSDCSQPLDLQRFPVIFFHFKAARNKRITLQR